MNIKTQIIWLWTLKLTYHDVMMLYRHKQRSTRWTWMGWRLGKTPEFPQLIIDNGRAFFNLGSTYFVLPCDCTEIDMVEWRNGEDKIKFNLQWVLLSSVTLYRLVWSHRQLSKSTKVIFNGLAIKQAIAACALPSRTHPNNYNILTSSESSTKRYRQVRSDYNVFLAKERQLDMDIDITANGASATNKSQVTNIHNVLLDSKHDKRIAVKINAHTSLVKASQLMQTQIQAN